MVHDILVCTFEHVTTCVYIYQSCNLFVLRDNPFHGGTAEHHLCGACHLCKQPPINLLISTKRPAWYGVAKTHHMPYLGRAAARPRRRCRAPSESDQQRQEKNPGFHPRVHVGVYHYLGNCLGMYYYPGMVPTDPTDSIIDKPPISPHLIWSDPDGARQRRRGAPRRRASDHFLQRSPMISLFCGKKPAIEGIVWVFATLYGRRDLCATLYLMSTQMAATL